MKTTIYIDGFNLYFSALKNTPYKWLDIVSLFSEICHIQNPKTEIHKVKFFTAPVKGKIATRGEQAVQSQQIYHKALKTLYPDILQIVEGFFIVQAVNLPKFQTPINKEDRVGVWKMEEKKTDVNIALHAFRDAMKGMEQIVLVSNDSDLVPLFEAIKEDFPTVQLAVIAPKLKTNEAEIRVNNKELSELSNWNREYILETEFQNAQLPQKIKTNKKPIIKPNYW